MYRSTSIIVAGSLILAAAGLSGCGKKSETDTNVVEMNASDGSMNDMTVVESATLDQAGGAMADTNAAEAGNASNAN
ncbi:hypothetical protein ASE00_14175 [Sphingomonas sp. Root710]|uniref:hypothetical protein n=1 Tax=Sphingomonas sp. Root710 TaxID=1736594 RepID=UPI0006FFCBDD|nr:hypothetical protein [Sphingomonas sp. Root710]KRB81157.1 hypothetical protein ASE00_14175 [Sphingomonas sp. Root710]